MKRRRRQHAAASVVLPGGARLTFRGYLPGRTCPQCARVWDDAAVYAKSVVVRNGRRFLVFGECCLQCDPPDEFPRDLRGVRPSTSYKDDSGKLVGWYERDRLRGKFGKMLPLETMGLRQMADGVFRPQPKIDRRSVTQQQARPRPPRRYRDVRDTRRTFPKNMTEFRRRHQHNLCVWCNCPFTDANPAVGDHDVPWADGGATDVGNCVALHASCNSKKNRRTLKQFLSDERHRIRTLFDVEG